MIQWLAALQPVLVGGVLLWSGGIKLFAQAAPAAARRSALAALTGEERAPAVYRTIGAVELVLALALVSPPVHPAEAVTAVVLTAGFLGYLAYARVTAPESSCGCMGTRRTPVTARGITRAGVLLLAAALSYGATVSWTTALGARPAAGSAVLAAAVMTIIVLSPEADHRWLFPLRRLRVRMRHPLAESVGDGDAGAPLEASLQQLHDSPAYRQIGGLLRSGPRESWDEDKLRILCYTAEYDGRRATAVFAVPLDRYEPSAVRVALVDEVNGSTLLAGGAVQPA